MRITQMINFLTELRHVYGDLEVVYRYDGGYSYQEIQAMTVLDRKRYEVEKRELVLWGDDSPIRLDYDDERTPLTDREMLEGDLREGEVIVEMRP